MARRNIYVPDALEERMKAVSDETNWSEVACRAFEKELGIVRPDKTELFDALRCYIDNQICSILEANGVSVAGGRLTEFHKNQADNNAKKLREIIALL